jgi:hypothetical protein
MGAMDRPEFMQKEEIVEPQIMDRTDLKQKGETGELQ